MVVQSKEDVFDSAEVERRAFLISCLLKSAKIVAESQEFTSQQDSLRVKRYTVSTKKRAWSETKVMEGKVRYLVAELIKERVGRIYAISAAKDVVDINQREIFVLVKEGCRSWPEKESGRALSFCPLCREVADSVDNARAKSYWLQSPRRRNKSRTGVLVALVAKMEQMTVKSNGMTATQDNSSFAS